jgi:hypothetical protein
MLEQHRIPVDQSGQDFERVALMEPERVIGLRVDIDPERRPAGPAVSHRGATGAATQVEHDR